MKFAITLLFAALSMSAANITVSMDYNFTGTTRCTATVTTNCLTQLEVGTYENGVLTTTLTIPLPSGTGQVTGIAGSFAINNRYTETGVTLAAVMVAKTDTGTRITSDPAKCTTRTGALRPDAPGNMNSNIATLTVRKDGSMEFKAVTTQAGPVKTETVVAQAESTNR